MHKYKTEMAGSLQCGKWNCYNAAVIIKYKTVMAQLLVGCILT